MRVVIAKYWSVFVSFLSTDFGERASMVEYATHVVRVKGQRVRASFRFRPEGQTAISYLMRSRNIDILFPTGQTEPKMMLQTL